MLRRHWPVCGIGAWMLMVAAAAQPVAAQTAPAGSPTFEVNTIKADRSGSSGVHSHFNNGQFTATGMTLKDLVGYSAFGIPEARITGGPKWIGEERFDIAAKTDAATTQRMEAASHEERLTEFRAMVQQMLEDRFKLAFHWETREMPVYALVVAKKGPLLHETAKPQAGTRNFTHNGQLTGEGITMDDLAGTLTQEMSDELGRVVVNQTGIKGRYDVTLKWTPESDAASGTKTNGTEADTPPPIFTAIQEQLGLKLEPSKGPIKVLVIDRVELPTEN